MSKTTDYPWIGAAIPSTHDDLIAAATQLNCDVAAIEAIWEVEASGVEFNADRSIPMRFEPHKMPGATMSWKESKALSTATRRVLFSVAYANTPNAALEATSWGAPQIMGNNHSGAGYANAEAMVRAMAASGGAQIRAFVAFVKSAGLDTHIRAHDWYKFAVGYNGTGEPNTYARKIETKYRSASGGKTSPVVLRFGAQGKDVRLLQNALSLNADGVFGMKTKEAVMVFQSSHGLLADGIVGFKTWQAINAADTPAMDDAPAPSTDAVAPTPDNTPAAAPAQIIMPTAQPSVAEFNVDRIGKWSGAVSAASAAAVSVRQIFPQEVWTVFGYALVAGGLAFALSFIWKKVMS